MHVSTKADIVFDREKCTLLINISDPSKLGHEKVNQFASENGFTRKEEKHITIIGFYIGQKIKNLLRKDTVDQIEKCINTISWEFIPTEFFYKIEKDYVREQAEDGAEHRESIIQMVEMEGISKFYEQLSKILNISLEIPPAHVTLFTKGSGPESAMGIGIANVSDFASLHLQPIYKKEISFKTIITPTRPQPDTVVAVFILKKFGKNFFPGIEEAVIENLPHVEQKNPEIEYVQKGLVLLDVGGGRFDHHSFKQMTCSRLVATYLGVLNDPALAKLLAFTDRDDFFGKGIISEDALDRAFGLSGLLVNLNKQFVNQADKVVNIVLPLIDAHYFEEEKRHKEMPLEVEALFSKKEAEVFSAKQRDKKLKCIFVQSNNPSLAGYLRSQLGGRYDVVVQRLETGHVNILTRPTKKIDLRSLAAVLRRSELLKSGKTVNLDQRQLSEAGRISTIPNWFYDTATNSIQNGGLNPKDIVPTVLDKEVIIKLVEVGLG